MVRLSKVSQHNIAPTANFELNTDGLNVSARNFSSDQDGEIISYLWDFGSGVTSSEIAPTYEHTKKPANDPASR
ncbi:PKD domain-containing protein [Vibrio chagasii]|nr:PKD domain-containing protein [Vibrio chagasii]